MKQVPDRKKLRREYLRHKVVAISGMGCLGYICIGAAGTAALATIVSLIGFFVFIRELEHALLSLVGGGLCACVYGGIAWACWRGIKAIKAKMRALPHIPPFTANTLPSEEVLVRGSDEPPVAQSEVLLRAAKEVETPKEELLRVTADK